MSELGDLIREVRETREMSQRELAAKAGLASSTISFIERGLTEKPDSETLAALADALGIDQRVVFESVGLIADGYTLEVPPELSDLLAQVIAMRGTPLYQQALKIMRETLALALMKLDPPSDE